MSQRRPACEVTEWRVHLGAHDTATTHLQETLSVMTDAPAAAGTVYIESCRARPVLRDLGSWRPSAWLRGGFEARLTALAGLGRQRVAVSEENVLGSMGDALRARPYPRLGGRVAVLAALARSPVDAVPVDPRPGRVLPGCYATALRHKRLSPLIVRRRARIVGRAPPRGTVTPSAEAIAEVEGLIRAGAHRRDPGGWQARVNVAYAGEARGHGHPVPTLRPGRRGPPRPRLRRGRGRQPPRLARLPD